MPIYSVNGLVPQIDPTAFIAPSATVIGDVVIGPNVSVWFGATLRGDSGRIVVGEGTNIQDGAVIHEETTIGKNCVIAHMTLVHRVIVGDNVLIANGAKVIGAMGAPVVIGDGAIIGAAALVTAGTKVEPNTLMMGIPAKAAREVDDRLRQVQAGPQQAYLRSKDIYKGETFTQVG
ncbi:MAG: gamma carbonic anhydrase family protein [Chloroflexi bacterium]|nr:gamma carbonic anhydrase family protein [Chloroflexota bacterium]